MTASRRDRQWLGMAVAFAATGASQLISQLVLGRVLGPADYGQIATLANLMSFVGVPLVAVQITVTGLVARGGSAASTFSRFALVGLACGALAALAAPGWAGGLAIDSVGACRVAALFLPSTFILAVARGNAVGQGRSRALAVAMTIAAVVRVGASIAGAHWLGIAGAASALVASELVLGLMLVVVVPMTGRADGPIVAREAVGATYSQIATWLVINVDLLWARRLLSPADAGRYLVVGSVAVGMVSFGQAFLWHHASSSIDRQAGPAIVRRSAAIVAITAAVGMPLAALALPVLLGDEFFGLTPLLLLGGAWAVLASVVQTGTATQLIAGRRGLIRTVPLAAVAVAGPPVWVAVLGARPVAMSLAALTNAAMGALVVMIPSLRSGTGTSGGASTPAVDTMDDRTTAELTAGVS